MSKKMLEADNKFELYMIDRWCCPEDGDSYIGSGSKISARPQPAFDQAFHMCVDIARRFNKRTHIVKMDSAKAAQEFPDGYFDVVFIDGDHSYDGCRRDILAWISKVRKGGYISGHDYDHPDQGNVKKAVDEIFRSDEIEVWGNRTWFVKIS